MMNLCSDVLKVLKGKTLVTAESCTGGWIGAALTAVAGSSAVFKGGIISYTNWVKEHFLKVEREWLDTYGAVSAPVAEAMAQGARVQLQADVAISVTGLAGPDGDDFGNPVGTVYVGYSDEKQTLSRKYRISGDRDTVRTQSVRMALKLVLEMNTVDNEKIS